MLIVSADKQATIDVLCSLSGISRKTAISAVIKGITTASAYVWVHAGGGVLTEETSHLNALLNVSLKVLISVTLIFLMRYVAGTSRCQCVATGRHSPPVSVMYEPYNLSCKIALF